MILGIGFDLVEIERIEMICARHQDSFLCRLLTDRELQYFSQFQSNRRRMEWVAGRFAAKEAVSKAFGMGIGGKVGLHDMEIVPDEMGKPELLVSRSLAELVPCTAKYHLSITHSKSTAGAFAVIEAKVSGT